MGSVVVAYATRAGSTAQVAEVVAVALRDYGANVELQPVGELSGVADYDAVIIASAVRHRRLLPEARDFLARQRRALRRKRLALFSVGMEAATSAGAQRSLLYLESAARGLDPPPLALAAFPGVWEPRALNGPMGVLLRLGDGERRDERDAMAVRRWAIELAPRLFDEPSLVSV